MFNIILASTPGGIIGVNNTLPWNLPEDLKWFKEVTLGKRVIMGRKTFESLGKALPNRENVVLSRDGITIDECINLYNDEENFVIGGAEIYNQFFELGKYDYVYHTVVHGIKVPEENAITVNIPFQNLTRICASNTTLDRTEKMYYNHTIYRKKYDR